MPQLPIPDLSCARILVTNDDGIHAPGLEVLERVARAISSDVWVVAPESEQSAAGHSLTIRRPLRMRRVSERRFAVDGTPTDAVLLGVNHLLKEQKPTLLLSGVNRGVNLGDDVTYSGTVAAAMEATLLGIPAIAFSQDLTLDHPVKWSTAEHWALEVLRRVVTVDWGKDMFLNVNFPDRFHGAVPGIEVTCQGKRTLGENVPERLDPRGEPYIWIGAQPAEENPAAGTDIAAILRGAVSVTPLCVDFTGRAALPILESVFSGE